MSTKRQGFFTGATSNLSVNKSSSSAGETINLSELDAIVRGKQRKAKGTKGRKGYTHADFTSLVASRQLETNGD